MLKEDGKTSVTAWKKDYRQIAEAVGRTDYAEVPRKTTIADVLHEVLRGVGVEAHAS